MYDSDCKEKGGFFDMSMLAICWWDVSIICDLIDMLS